MIRVLFVCLGNICRSPAGEHLFRHLAEGVDVAGIEVASCGLGDWNKGEAPNAQMQKVAKRKHDLELTGTASAFKPSYFETFDYILAADHSVLHELRSRIRSSTDLDKLFLMGDFGRKYRGQEVPDPFHGTEADFELAYEMIEDHCEGFLDKIMKEERE